MAKVITEYSDETGQVVSQTLVPETKPPRGIYWPLSVLLFVIGVSFFI